MARLTQQPNNGNRDGDGKQQSSIAQWASGDQRWLLEIFAPVF